MNSMNDSGVVAGPASGQTSHTHPLRGLAGTGFIATLAAMAATTLAAALAQAIGVDFEVPDGGETIPLSGFAVVTGFFSVVGIVIAAALLRWSARPAERFVRTAVALTAISLAPPRVEVRAEVGRLPSLNLSTEPSRADVRCRGASPSVGLGGCRAVLGILGGAG
jgi:hypothetical protein